MEEHYSAKTQIWHEELRDAGNPCVVCEKRDGEKPICYKMTPYCCAHHQDKVEGKK